MTNHPIAEQDSLERLITRLRSEGQLLDQLARTLTRGKSQVSQAGDACREAADTLCQMRDALEQIKLAGENYRAFKSDIELWQEMERIAATTLRATTKIEKE